MEIVLYTLLVLLVLAAVGWMTSARVVQQI